MPRRRKASKTYFGPTKQRRQNPNKKQAQMIKTRLIEISMRMEDYVYHEAMISESQAELFIREVNSYKTDCTNDERSLQVIEKLTRCMKAIIAEHQEQRFMSPSTNNEQYYMDDGYTNYASPVYSVPDEDRTQIAQTYTNNEINDTGNYNMQYDGTLVTNIIQPVPDNNRATEIIDLCDDDDSQDNTPTVPNSTLGNIATIATAEERGDMNINNALSNLYLRDMSVFDELMDTDTKCSQSILNNYEVINNVQQNNTSINVNVAGNMTINNVRDIERRLQTETSKMPNQAPVITNPTVTNKPLAINLNTLNIRKDSGVYNVNHPLIAKVSKAINNTFPNAEKLITANPINSNIAVVQQNCILVKNNSNNIHDKTYSTRKAEDVPTIAKMLKDKTSDQNREANSPVAIKKKRAPRKKKSTESKAKESRKLKIEHFTVPRFNDQKINKTMETVPNKKYGRKKNNAAKSVNHTEFSIPIYNKNVVHDLSWLENIRYVREIGEDEYDRKLSNLNEDFWDNCLLPPNFDESDFYF